MRTVVREYYVMAESCGGHMTAAYNVIFLFPEDWVYVTQVENRGMKHNITYCRY